MPGCFITSPPTIPGDLQGSTQEPSFFLILMPETTWTESSVRQPRKDRGEGWQFCQANDRR